MPTCSNCRHYYGKIENYRFFCCAMHPNGLPAEDCPDWEEDDCKALAPPYSLMPPDIRRMIQLEAEREWRWKRRNLITTIVQLFLMLGALLNWFSAIKRLGCW